MLLSLNMRLNIVQLCKDNATRNLDWKTLWSGMNGMISVASGMFTLAEGQQYKCQDSTS